MPKRKQKNPPGEPASSPRKSGGERLKHATKYHRARIRKFLFTHGPNRITGGRLKRRHLAAIVAVESPELSSIRKRRLMALLAVPVEL